MQLNQVLSEKLTASWDHKSIKGVRALYALDANGALQCDLTSLAAGGHTLSAVKTQEDSSGTITE